MKNTHRTLVSLSARAVRPLVAAIACAGALSATAPAFAADFDGARIEMTMPFKEGGGTDTWGRFYAPLISEQLPGQPVVVVKNIPGGGSTSGANQFQLRAKPDGRDIFASSGSTMFPYVLGDKRVKYEYKDWTAVLASPTGGVVYISSDLGVKNVAELVKLKDADLKYASQGATSLDLITLLSFEVLGLDVKAVFGMKGRGEARLAFERGEVNIDDQTTSGFIKKVQPLVDEGKAVPLFSWGVLGKDGKIQRDPTFPDLPHFVEAYEMVHGSAPSSERFRAWKSFFVAGYAAQKGLFLPKGTPDDVVQAYQEAASKAVAVPGFKEKAQDVLGDYDQAVGEEARMMFAEAVSMDDEAKGWVINWLNTKYSAGLQSEE
ncbi:Bug family tripartite tricarboxylate transporter substrate binding protein [Marinobacterium rhizophilum]|uniref:Tricarboxylate transporter n=1 Tax=Marinobacterium rhizophilum TaxID=420402 RepID=A0ABY5HGL9_9GAMM|nr:tripartite tricarboxylate transporter substrate-binding protein [Marinobacterium rhizophilum]UTW11505.1 tricarboxylate transporter [Marinobacterium rhizophilum]